MNEEEKLRIKGVISGIEETKKTIPTFSDLCKSQIFGSLFQSMNTNEKEEVKALINEYIEEKIHSLKKTNGEQLFKRFYETHTELFRSFRALNENDESTETPEFQTVGEEVEKEMFKLEGILTEKMIKQIKGLDQVLSSFYNIVYLFFPRYNSIK